MRYDETTKTANDQRGWLIIFRGPIDSKTLFKWIASHRIASIHRRFIKLHRKLYKHKQPAILLSRNRNRNRLQARPYCTLYHVPYKMTPDLATTVASPLRVNYNQLELFSAPRRASRCPPPSWLMIID